MPIRPAPISRPQRLSDRRDYPQPSRERSLRTAGIRFLSDVGEQRHELGNEDVVILPAFGVTVEEMLRLIERRLHARGHDLRVGAQRVEERGPLRAGWIHGGHSRQDRHEETRATASQALKYPRGRYLIVLDRDEAGIVCDYIRHGGDRAAFLTRFGSASSPDFDPDSDLSRIGCANQTTMLMSESLEIGEMFREAMRDRYGDEGVAAHFRAFDTICSATQERQDAVEALLQSEPLDLMIVVGGYNSSNTCNLARICAARVRTYHIADPECLVSPTRIRHRPIGAPSTTQTTESMADEWLPSGERLVVGLTAGASTPNNIVGQVIETLRRFANPAG